MSLTLNLEPIVSAEVQKSLTALNLEQKIEELIGEATAKASKIITVKLGDEEGKKVGIQHKQFAYILKKIARGDNIIVTGQAGNGKTYVVEQCAKALNLPFHAMSVSSQSTKTDIMGFVDARGVYRYNGFITAFRDGGVFCLDEVDAGNANVLTSMNSAISNGWVETPSGEFIKAHKDFRCVATANTTGRGANTKYVGRNKLDLATLDRFGMIRFDLDEDIELQLCGNNKDFHRGIKAMRKLADKNYEEVFISQRSSIRLYDSLVKDGDSVEEALEYAVFKGLDEDICSALKKAFNNATNTKVWYKDEVTATSSPEDEYIPKFDEVTATSSPENDEEPLDEMTHEDTDAEFNW